LKTQPILSRIVLSALAAATPLFAFAQSPPQPSPPNSQNPSLTIQTNLVLVPALVRKKSGANVYALTANDFLLTDDGTPQKLSLVEDTDHQPLALVIVLETGGAGAREFQHYASIAPPLAPMLSSIVGNVFHQIAVVTFDSQPHLLQSFTGDIDEAAAALRTLQPGCTRQEHYDNCTGPYPVHDVPLGDNGAAILDSLTYAVDLLNNLAEYQPPSYRRAILLISETLDPERHPRHRRYQHHHLQHRFLYWKIRSRTLRRTPIARAHR
jgi:VWFA-related protein